MSWGGFILTNAGRNLLAKVQAGTIAELNITRFGMGDGSYSGSYSTITNLVSQKQSVPLRAKKAKDNYVNIEGYFSNEGLASGFYFREWGIFAMNGAQEILYAYDNSGADAEYIAPDGSIRYEKLLKAALAITADVNVTINTSGVVYVTTEELEDKLSNISSNASDIRVEDTAGHFASDNVEGALAELFQNKATLENGKVPASQLPDMDYLLPTGNGKDITVTFTEAATRTSITSGEKLSVLFGKIKKYFTDLKAVAFSGSYTDLSDKPTSLPASGGTATTLTGLLASIAELNFVKGVTGAIQTQLSGKAAINHASTIDSYGAGTASNFGHVKVRNDLLGTETEGATVSPAQIKKMNDKLPVLIKTQTIPLSKTSVAQHVVDLTGDFSGYDEIILKTTGTITSFNGSTPSEMNINLYALNQAGGTWYGLLRLFNMYVSTQTVLSNISIEGISVIKKAERKVKNSDSEFKWASINGYLGEFILPVQVVLSNFNFSTINSLSGSLMVEIYGLKYS